MSALKLYHRTRKRRASPEAELQKAVVQYLQLAGVPGLLYFSVPNEGKRSRINGAHMKRMGLLPGVSDLVVIIPFNDGYVAGAQVLFLELKAKGEKQTANQEAFQHAIYALNNVCIDYEVADSIDKAISILTEYGAIKNVPRRRAASPLSRKAA